MIRNSKFIIFSVLITITTILSIFCTVKKPIPSAEVKISFDTQLLKLQSVVDHNLLPAIEKKDEKAIKTSFLLSRAEYKKMETRR